MLTRKESYFIFQTLVIFPSRIKKIIWSDIHAPFKNPFVPTVRWFIFVFLIFTLLVYTTKMSFTSKFLKFTTVTKIYPLFTLIKSCKILRLFLLFCSVNCKKRLSFVIFSKLEFHKCKTRNWACRKSKIF